MDAAVPVIARGHNVAVLIPPAPEALAPLLAAIPKRPILLIAPDRDRALAAARLCGVDGAAIVTAGGKPHAAPPLLAAGAADALEQLSRSALQPGDFAAIVLAWPEDLDADGQPALEAVMAEAGGDAQRLILTSQPDAASQQLVERYAFKAMTYGFPPAERPAGWTTHVPAGAAQFVIAPPARLAEWMFLVRDALEPGAEARPVVTCPHTHADAAALIAIGQPVLVLAPYQVRWARTLFQPLTPFPLPGAVSGLEQRTARTRRDLAALVEAGDLDRELLVLAPLFDRFDAATVAAAALRMASHARAAAPSGTTASSAAPATPGSGPTRVWIGVGRKDNARPGDLVGALVNEAKVPADAIGKIELKDLFCLVDVRSDYAEAAVKGLTGVQLRGRRLVARLDRGPGPGTRPPRRV